MRVELLLRIHVTILDSKSLRHETRLNKAMTLFLVMRSDKHLDESLVFERPMQVNELRAEFYIDGPHGALRILFDGAAGGIASEGDPEHERWELANSRVVLAGFL